MSPGKTRAILRLRPINPKRFGKESSALSHPDIAVVTGAFSYTGRYVAHRLIEGGVEVRTLTRSLDRQDPFDGSVKAYPLDFSDPDGLCRSMEGANVLYNTYWIRFGRGRTTFDQAVRNSKVLFDAAANACVERIVHFSVANASSESKLPYFGGKGQVEDILANGGLSYAIIRPTLVFGEGDLLLNNMAGRCGDSRFLRFWDRNLQRSTHCRRGSGETDGGCRLPDRVP